MVKRTGILMLAVAAMSLTLASANDAQAFFGRRGGSEGSSGGCWGSGGGSGGSSGSFGSHGGRFFRHRHGDSCGSHGGSGGSCGESNSCGNCNSCGETTSCGCGETASNGDRNQHEQQAADRDDRGERREAGYNSETRIRSNQPMPAPEQTERRGDNDRQARDRVNESREAGPSLSGDTKRDSDKSAPSADKSSDQKQQE